MALEITNTPDPSRGVDQVTRTPKTQLGKDDFLRLLTTQLQNQDPLNPQDNSQMIAQTAQFSQLEQTTNMVTSLNKFITQSQDTSKTSALNMLGKTIAATVAGQTDPVVGQVSQVKFDTDGTAHFRVGDTDVLMSEITDVAALA